MRGVGLLLFHPGVAKIDCRDCMRRLYDLEKGEPVTYIVGPNREEVFEDGPEHRPPCQTGTKCPRGNPEEGPSHDLTPLGDEIFRTYLAQRATSGRSLTAPQRRDWFLMQMMAVVDGLVRRWEREVSAERTAEDTGYMLMALRGK